MIKTVKIKDGILHNLIPQKKFTFNDSVNIICGLNGCGKSLLVKTIAEYCFVNDVGASTYKAYDYKYHRMYNDVNSNSFIRCNFNKISHVELNWSGSTVFMLSHDYFSNFHINAGYEMSSGKRVPELQSFIPNWRNHLSTGQMVINYYNDLLNLNLTPLIDTFSEYYQYKRSYWEDFIKSITNDTLIKKPTLILDEIDLGLDVKQQYIFFNEILPQLAEKYQVLLITHNVLFTEKYHKIVVGDINPFDYIKK